MLKQEQAAFEFCRKQIAECDRQLEQYLQKMEDRSQGATLPEEKRKDRLQEEGESAAVRLATAVVSHDGHRPNSDRWY